MSSARGDLVATTATADAMSLRFRSRGADAPLHHRRRAATSRVALLVALAVLVGSCGYIEMVRRHRRLREAFEREPRLGLVQEFAPEECLQVFGGLLTDPAHDEPLAVVAVSQQYAHNEIVGWHMVPGGVGYYSVLLPEGTYDLLVFADLNRDDVFGNDEVVGRTASGTPLVVSRGQAADGLFVDGPTLRLDYARPSTEELPVPMKVASTGSVVASLDDEFFDAGYGIMGLYNPSKFLEHTQGYFFGLEPFDAKKTQVLFVHGASGTPRDWKYLVAGIDRSRFQPWFFYYPSGLPLDRTGAILAHAIDHLAASQRVKLERLVIVAHSMGGLVARAALNRLTQAHKPSYLKMFITLSTPYGGHDAAESAVEHAPEVVPSWYDMAPESLFLHNLTATSLPDDLPFFLLFSYANPRRVRVGANSDGVVTIRSELDMSAQVQATRSFGFDASHTGILQDPSVRSVFNELLAPAAPRPSILNDPIGAVQRVLTSAGTPR